jgi:fused signal recognition particle receptor
MSALLYVLVALAFAGALFFAWSKRGETKALPPPETPSKGTPSEAPAPTATAEPSKKASPEASGPPSQSSRPTAPAAEATEKKAAEMRSAPAPLEDFGRSAAYDPIVVQKGLSRTRGGLMAKLAELIRGKREIDPSILQQIEEVLLTSDVGVATTQRLVERLNARLKNNELGDEDKVWAALRTETRALLGKPERLKLRGKPTVVMMVGVNGSGKTTTIGKLAAKLKAQGKSVVLGAGDTFRAAAVQQLEVWAQREGATVVKGKEQGDPAGVLFEAVQKAREIGADVVLCDTAGRLHTKSNLMDELTKVHRSIGKAIEGAPHEVLLVLDATNGQNALQQARQFKEAVPVTGVVLTKLDGTAKGGMVLAIADELGLPVRYIGIGERPADLREFEPNEFVEALFGGRESLSSDTH